MSSRVLTTEGPVRGSTDAGVSRFMGIPYAAAPVHELRFQAPQPAPRHEDVLDATHPGPPAPQFTTDPALIPPATEDNWLTLNVFAPAQAVNDPTAKHPVMVWIHGGAYVHGTGSDPASDGSAFARSGVIMVSLNYRLGIEGFMQFPDAPANRGLLDQLAALAWVQNNIHAFGGDPENITVFGESAGAGSIQCLMTMPEATGLFRRAILQSPPAMIVNAELAAEVTAEFAALGTSVAEELGVSALEPTAQSFAQLSPAQAEELMRRFAATQGKYYQRWGKAAAFTPPLVPVVDGRVLRRVPWSAYREFAKAAAGRDIPADTFADKGLAAASGGAGSRGTASSGAVSADSAAIDAAHIEWLAGLDVLVGQTAQEFALFNFYAGATDVTMERALSRVALVGPGSTLLEDAQSARSAADSEASAGGAGEVEAAAQQANQAWLDTMPQASANQIFERVQSDYMFTVPTLLAATNQVALARAQHGAAQTADTAPAAQAGDAAAKQAGTSGAAYVYLLDVEPAGGVGAPHVADLPPLFDQFDSDHGRTFYPQVSDADRALGQRMREAWVSFASTGDPGWEAWSAGRSFADKGLTDKELADKALADTAGTHTQIFGYADRQEPHPFWERFRAFAPAPSRALGVLARS